MTSIKSLVPGDVAVVELNPLDSVEGIVMSVNDDFAHSRVVVTFIRDKRITRWDFPVTMSVSKRLCFTQERVTS